MIQARIFVSGYVQGVGYRAHVIHQARQMNICGWARNLSDGRVEIFTQADESTLDAFISTLWKGTMLSEVKDIVIEHEKLEEHLVSFEKADSV